MARSHSRAGVLKRRPDLPPEARDILESFSKADLLEAAWWLAALGVESMDDGPSVRHRLLEELKLGRERSGRTVPKICRDTPPSTH
jgi:hypothetical protein